tara:strand:- start:956 stop:1507 length:552 start_codon:yes stop_codon:yes gene_type:complete
MFTPLSPFQFSDSDLGRLDYPVGPTERNRPDDVAKIETALDRLGYFTVDRNQGPSGVYHSELKDSMIDYQTARNLARDGIANPDGPTIATMSNDIAKAPAKRRREDREKIKDRGEANRAKINQLFQDIGSGVIDYFQGLADSLKSDVERRAKASQSGSLLGRGGGSARGHYNPKTGRYDEIYE